MPSIDELLKGRDDARARMKTALAREQEIGDAFTKDAASFQEWRSARDAFNQALRHYEFAQNVYLKARR